MEDKKPNSLLGFNSHFLICLIILSVALIPSSSQSTVATSPYDSGYNHGFSDAQRGGHPYLVRSGGASAHTDTFMQGYNDGFRTGIQQKRQSITPQQQPTESPTSSAPQLQQPSPPPTDGEDNAIIMVFLLFLVVVVGAVVWQLKHRGRQYKERHAFSNSVKENILEKQHHKCASCNRLLNVVEYHHKDGNRSNNKQSNCQALCPNCHAIKTHSKRIR
jgi:hypothetical protein